MFRKKKEAYEKSLTKEQKLAIKDERIRLKELKEENAKRAQLKSRLRELGKPTRPKTSFILYYIDENGKGKTTIQAVKAKYAALNEADKNVYKQKAAALMEDYRWVNYLRHFMFELKYLINQIKLRLNHLISEFIAKYKEK